VRKQLREILGRTGLSKAGFRAYEFLLSLSPKAYCKNRRYLRSLVPRPHFSIPPVKLIVLVSSNPDIEGFLQGGEMAAKSIIDTLMMNGVDFAQLKSVLDFGCGCGRVTRHWYGLTEARVYGTDYNTDLVAWCRLNLPFARFGTNQLRPPLDYQDESFDLVYALSVFTHLPESTQTEWIREMTRVIAPGGCLLLTTHGERYVSMLTDSERKRFRAGQLVVRDSEVAGTNLCSAFHPEEYVRDQLASDLEFVAYIPEGAKGNPHQDVYLLRKPYARTGPSDVNA
jgi:SAM-dependent methyltransferase